MPPSWLTWPSRRPVTTPLRGRVPSYVRALVDMNLDRQALAETRFDEALGLFTALGDAAGMADIVEARAMTTFGNGDITDGASSSSTARPSSSPTAATCCAW